MAALLEQRIAELKQDRAHGGSWMARRAVESLVEFAHRETATGDELLERLVDAGRQLSASRPAMAGITGALGRLLATARAGARRCRAPTATVAPEQPARVLRLPEVDAERLEHPAGGPRVDPVRGLVRARVVLVGQRQGELLA